MRFKTILEIFKKIIKDKKINYIGEKSGKLFSLSAILSAQMTDKQKQNLTFFCVTHIVLNCEMTSREDKSFLLFDEASEEKLKAPVKQVLFTKSKMGVGGMVICRLVCRWFDFPEWLQFDASFHSQCAQNGPITAQPQSRGKLGSNGKQESFSVSHKKTRKC